VRVRANHPDGRVNPQRGGGQAQILHGHAADTDVIVASTKAYLAAMNRVLATLSPADRPSSPAAAEAPQKAVS
jgi:2-isopropylmalate synthase